MKARRSPEPFFMLARISTRLQVETIMPSATSGCSASFLHASGSRDSGIANRSRTSTGAVL